MDWTEIFRKGPPIRPRETEPEDAEERNGKRLRFASNSMENEKDENNIPKEWTTSNSRIEQEQVDQNREKDSSVSEAQCSVLGRPISIWTTHVVSSAHQLKSSFSSPSDTSAVKATNGRKPDVKIARRAKVKEPSKKFEQMMKTFQKDEVKKRMKQG